MKQPQQGDAPDVTEAKASAQTTHADPCHSSIKINIKLQGARGKKNLRRFLPLLLLEPLLAPFLASMEHNAKVDFCQYCQSHTQANQSWAFVLGLPGRSHSESAAVGGEQVQQSPNSGASSASVLPTQDTNGNDELPSCARVLSEHQAPPL
eukprot:6879514-Karenia_brevis.AAC.1